MLPLTSRCFCFVALVFQFVDSRKRATSAFRPVGEIHDIGLDEFAY